MKFSLLRIFLFFLTFQSEVFAEPEKCKSLDSSKWTNCIGSIALKGEAYVGSFKDGLPHGKGTYTFYDGATYVGEFFNGKESESARSQWQQWCAVKSAACQAWRIGSIVVASS